MSPDVEPYAIERVLYLAPPGGIVAERRLVALEGPDAGRSFVFFQDLHVGRLKPTELPVPGTLYIADPTVSSRHCVISQDPHGRCFVRDTSLNGTSIDGRRIVPGTEPELRIGQVVSVSQGHRFRLDGDTAEILASTHRATQAVSAPILVTVLIGDIQGYTSLVREAPGGALQSSVSALFQALQDTVADLGGTLKEYPGDAILAYWQCSDSERGATESCATRACRAALALDTEAVRLSSDASVWGIRDHPLRMEWGLATGQVTIQSFGGRRPLGLSMVGEPLVKAYRLEKLADDATGRILVCARTRSLAGAAFRFGDVGEQRLHGFPSAEPVYALLGAA